MKRIALFLLVTTYMTIGASAQDAELKLRSYAANMLRFSSVCTQEKVYLQFDNTSYYTGETIWFKAFVVNASDNRRAPSKVLYVDFLSPGGDVLKSLKLPVVAGQADGSFSLNDASTAHARELRGVLPYPSGFYEIRAYTSYMLNFSKDLLFRRILPVFEKPEKDGNYYGEKPVIRETRAGRHQQLRHQPESVRGIDVTFYPEGGHLIAGVPNRVAFKVMGSDGLGADADGVLNDSLSLTCVHDGMGSIVFTPEKTQNRAVFSFGGRRYDFRLPDAERDGYLLKADVSGTNLTATVLAAGKAPSDTLGLTLTCRGELKDFQTVFASSSYSEVKFPLADASEGVHCLTLFDRDGTVLATRHVYVKAGNAPPSIAMASVKDRYGPFELMRLDFELKDGAGQPFRDRFCLSVRDGGCPGSATETDIRSSLLLSSDLRGLVYMPEYYFESDDGLHQEALDLLMLVQGWEKYDWRKRAGVEEYNEVHRMESGLTLNGWVKSHWSDRPVDCASVSIALVPSDRKRTQRLRCEVDSTGYFGFDVADFYDKAKLTLIAKPVKKGLFSGTPRMVLERSIRPEVMTYSLADKVLTVPEQKHTSKMPDADPDDGFPTVIQEDLGYILPEAVVEGSRMYVDYYTFKAYDVQKYAEDTFDAGEYTTGIAGFMTDNNIRLTVDDMKVFYYVHDSKRFYDDSRNSGGLPVGDPLFNTMDIISLHVYDRPMYLADILKLCPLYANTIRRHIVSIPPSELYSERYYLLDIEVKDRFLQSTRKEEYDMSRRLTTMQGYSSPFEFYNPQYPDGPVRGDVDYRRTLYWNPNVITDAEGHASVEFYNNSYSTHFNVSGAGITAGGTPYVLDAEF